MQIIKLKTRVDAEGKVILQVPQDLANQELEIAIVYQLVSPNPPTQTGDS